MKKLFALLFLSSASALFLGGCVVAIDASNQHNAVATSKSVIHVVTVAFKEGTTQPQIQAALDGAMRLPAEFPGIKRVWTNALKVQNPEGAKVKKTHVIVMEFASEQALKDYTDSPAQKKWYELYLPIRDVSTTYDITN